MADNHSEDSKKEIEKLKENEKLWKEMEKRSYERIQELERKCQEQEVKLKGNQNIIIILVILLFSALAFI
jgi:uncharacterized membrane protein